MKSFNVQRSTFNVLGFVLLLTAQPAWAAPPAPEQMEISARTTTYDGKAHTYLVKGDVRITLPQLAVTCQEAVVYANAAENQLLRVVFSGNVEVKKGTDTFRADRITYHVAERRLVAEGSTRTRLKLPAQGAGPLQGP